MIHALNIPVPPSVLVTVHLAVFVLGAWWLKHHPLETRRATCWVMLAIVLASLFEFLTAEPPRPFEDFRFAYYPAGQAVLLGPAALLPEIERGVEGFVNLPILAYLFVPLALIPQKYAMLLFAAASIISAGVAWWLLVRVARLGAGQAILLLFLFAVCGPLHNGVKEGNTSQFVLALLAGALFLLQARRDFAAGALLGLAAIIKLPLLLACAALVLLARWRAAAGALATGLLLIGASIAVFGWDMHRIWYHDCIAPFGSAPLTAFNAQSLQAFAARLATGGDGLWDWKPHTSLQQYGAVSRIAVLLIYAATVIWVAKVHTRIASAPEAGTSHDLVTVRALLVAIVLACITSPLSWSHYYAWMLVPAAFLLAPFPFAGKTPAARAVDWLAIALVCVPVVDLRPSPGIALELYARTAASATLAGGVLMLWILLRRPQGAVAHRPRAGLAEAT